MRTRGGRGGIAAALVLIVVGIRVSLAQGVEQSGMPRSTTNATGASSIPWPGTGRMDRGELAARVLEKRRLASVQVEQMRLMTREAAMMAALATDLSAALGRESVSSVKVDDDTRKRAESIEKLAHNVRLRMLGGHS